MKNIVMVIALLGGRSLGAGDGCAKRRAVERNILGLLGKPFFRSYIGDSAARRGDGAVRVIPQLNQSNTSHKQKRGEGKPNINSAAEFPALPILSKSSSDSSLRSNSESPTSASPETARVVMQSPTEIGFPFPGDVYGFRELPKKDFSEALGKFMGTQKDSSWKEDITSWVCANRELNYLKDSEFEEAAAWAKKHFEEIAAAEKQVAAICKAASKNVSPTGWEDHQKQFFGSHQSPSR